jgi:hypothetical protein
MPSIFSTGKFSGTGVTYRAYNCTCVETARSSDVSLYPRFKVIFDSNHTNNHYNVQILSYLNDSGVGWKSYVVSQDVGYFIIEFQSESGGSGSGFEQLSRFFVQCTDF